MPALNAAVTNYLTAVKNSLKDHPSDDATVDVAPASYIRAMHLTAALELLENALDQTSVLTAIGGSTTTVVDGAGTFVPSQQVGNYVTFAANTTTVALRGVTRRIIANTDSTLTVELLPAACVNTDTYTIVGGVVADEIAGLRGGKGLGEAVHVTHSPDSLVRAALVHFIQQLGLVTASGTLTLTGNAAAPQTVTIGSRTYTFTSPLTNTANNVLVGATASDSLDNLIAAINAGAGSGTLYGTGTVQHADVRAEAGPGDTMIVRARQPGTAGNSIATTETLGNGSWGAATLAGGAVGSPRESNLAHPSLVTAAGSTTSVINLNTLGGSFKIDELKGAKIVVGTNAPRQVVTNNENTVTLDRALSVAPGAAVAVTITRPADMAGPNVPGNLRQLAGDFGGENFRLADLLDQLQTAVVAYTLPT